MDKVPMTAKGLAALEDELKRLKQERPLISKAIGIAREHGDLSENAEYHAAKERQGMIEARLKDVEGIISHAQVIDPSGQDTGQVRFGLTVVLADTESDEKVTYKILGEDEANVSEGKISVTSPVARALLGKSVGDEIKVSVPRGTREFEILEIRVD